MATRKGATKTDSRGRRFRYDGRRWEQIKATGNGNNTTSARNRSARQRRSNATVTDSDNVVLVRAAALIVSPMLSPGQALAMLV